VPPSCWPHEQARWPPPALTPSARTTWNGRPTHGMACFPLGAPSYGQRTLSPFATLGKGFILPVTHLEASTVPPPCSNEGLAWRLLPNDLSPRSTVYRWHRSPAPPSASVRRGGSESQYRPALRSPSSRRVRSAPALNWSRKRFIPKKGWSVRNASSARAASSARPSCA
jgi:hypothetical protein